MQTESFVVVTVADNGMIHAWGDHDGLPFRTRSRARSMVKSLIQSSVDLYGVNSGRAKICKILGDPPVMKEGQPSIEDDDFTAFSPD